MAEAGMTPMQAIVATTAMAAACIGLGDRVGTVEPGKLADLVVVDGDPLKDPGLLRDHARFALVMKDGQVHRGRLPTTPESGSLDSDTMERARRAPERRTEAPAAGPGGARPIVRKPC